MDCCWLQEQTGDALHALICALAYNIRWLTTAMRAKSRRALSWLLQTVEVAAKNADIGLVERTGQIVGSVRRWVGGPGVA